MKIIISLFIALITVFAAAPVMAGEQIHKTYELSQYIGQFTDDQLFFITLRGAVVTSAESNSVKVESYKSLSVPMEYEVPVPGKALPVRTPSDKAKTAATLVEGHIMRLEFPIYFNKNKVTATICSDAVIMVVQSGELGGGTHGLSTSPEVVYFQCLD